MSPTLSQIQNFHQVSPMLLTAGQPFEEQFPAIQAAGCQVVINLAAEYSPDYIPEEGELVENLGMTYIPIPVDWEAPQLIDLQAFFEAMERSKGQKLFVHCARNMRVSAFVFLYRVLRLHQPLEACLPDLHALWQPDGVWQSFIDTALAAGSPS